MSSSTEVEESIISGFLSTKSEVSISQHCRTDFHGQSLNAGVKLRLFEGFNPIGAFTAEVSFYVQVQMLSSIVEHSCTFGVPGNNGGVSTKLDNNVF